ncbi:C-type lectin 37Db-like [Drosophila elegans]|uniref:C-type lectin 37Db-like n=1 Tax=Drosophila elegans TaxID=30023 RepID=UPI001BC85C05|nr:C-type lectin 37Db-like [Drosophila elegans]
MFSIGIYILFAFFACSLAETQENSSSVCILKDAPTQCGAFCLAAQIPLFDHNNNVQQQLNDLAVLLNETQKKLDRFETKLDSKMDEIRVPKVSETAVIPSGFEKIGSRYFYIARFELKWIDAVMACRLIGGYLAAFQNEEEFIGIQRKLAYRWYWLGINEIFVEGQFFSVASGKPATIFKWANGYPDNGYGKEDCIAMQNDYMDDGLCDNKHYFICQLDNIV